MYDFQKSEVFSLGMIALEAATLENVQECYDMDRFLLNQDKIEELLKKVKVSYSLTVYCLIKDMLTLDHNMRPDYRTILRSLAPGHDPTGNSNKFTYCKCSAVLYF